MRSEVRLNIGHSTKQHPLKRSMLNLGGGSGMTQRARLGKQARKALEAQAQAQKNLRVAQERDTAACLQTTLGR